MSRRVVRLSLLAVPLLLIAGGPAMAMPASCQIEFQKKTAERESAVARINAMMKRRPSAQQACNAFNGLVGIENRMLKWMQDNKDWCQLPDEAINQMSEARARTRQVSGQACTAARRQAQEGVAGGANRAPPPGSGVRLPQGAL